jgi:hypothetical protein
MGERLVRGQTCSSAPDVVAGAELVPSTGDGAAADASSFAASCTAFCCLLTFFLAALLTCTYVATSGREHWMTCTAAASGKSVVRCRRLYIVACSQRLICGPLTISGCSFWLQKGLLSWTADHMLCCECMKEILDPWCNGAVNNCTRPSSVLTVSSKAHTALQLSLKTAGKV